MKRLVVALAVSTAMSLAHAAPGAHGPNGEHLDGPAGSTRTGAAAPMLEAHTELFELVGQLAADELSVLVDRYETNEPVLNAVLEVESGGVQARSTLHSDLGDYSFTDEKLLTVLRQPGDHALVFTLVAGGEADLIEGTLRVGQAATPSHDPTDIRFYLGAGLLLLLAIIGLTVRLTRRRNAPGKVSS